MRSRRAVVGLLMLALAGAGCAQPLAADERAREPLYFAMELKQNGAELGHPKLLGFEGRKVTAEKTSQGNTAPDYRLVLKPSESGAGYRVVLELTLPGGTQSVELAMLHGEERTVKFAGATELKLLLMRVDSPEFRALMRAAKSGKGVI